MTTLMLAILAVWFAVLFLGPPIWLALGLAAIVFGLQQPPKSSAASLPNFPNDPAGESSAS